MNEDKELNYIKEFSDILSYSTEEIFQHMKIILIRQEIISINNSKHFVVLR